MKSDSNNFTFDRAKHYGSVRTQQGRVQLASDGDEQNDIFTNRIETEAGDVIGLCGAPMHYPAFHIVGGLGQLSTEELALPGNNPVPAGFKLPDFLISAGRYYVDGILCENEQLTSYLNQPDLLDAPPIPGAGLYLIYVDVWQRLLTTLDDPSIREIALGGPDTAARAKTVWQVKHWFAGTGPANCLTKFEAFEKLIAPSDGTLSARTKPGPASTDPCIVPPGAGYFGLENQLYRIEIHDGGTALDATTAGTSAGRVEGKVNQISVADSWRVGQAVEVFARKSDDPITGTLAYITNVESGNELETRKARRTTRTKTKIIAPEIGGKILTLDTDVSKIALDELFVRPAKATFKWSRDNGVVVTAIQSIDGEKVTVHDLGPDDALGFKIGQWVEISDDGLELNGLPGQLARIIDVDSAINLITLNIVATPLDASQPSGVNEDRHPKLRRWDGVGAVKFAAGDYFLDLESGVQVRFSGKGSVRTGDYWTIAARTATADTQSGNIEWPRDAAGEPVEQLPFGIKHHYCRLAMLHVVTGPSMELSTTEKTAGPEKSDDIEETGISSPATRFDWIEDCRHLFPPITELTNLFFVSGDGQEAMPNEPLPQLLRASVFNGSSPVAFARVRFQADGNGRLAPNIPGLAVSNTNTFTAVTGADGIASCAWRLEPDVSKPSQHVEARLLDADLQPTPATVGFNGNLSIAEQVYYNPGNCQPLSESRTVQKVIDQLSHLVSLYEVSGNNQKLIKPGDPLPQPLIVFAANRCGPVTDPDTHVRFRVVAGTGTVNGQPEVIVPVVAGLASCVWTPDSTSATRELNQEVEASLVPDASLRFTSPTKVRFSCTLSLAAHVFYDPAKCPGLKSENVTNVQEAIDHLCKKAGCCDTTVGRGGQFERLDVALRQLLAERMDVCICLLPGEHILPSAFVIEKESARVKIAGCGWGSVIRLSQKLSVTNQPDTTQPSTTQAAEIQPGPIQPGPIQPGPTHSTMPVTAVGLDSFILRDVEVIAEGTIEFQNCDEVMFAGCHLMKLNSVAHFITIAGAKRIRFEGNVVEASAPLTANPTLPAEPFAGTEILALTQPTDQAEFERKASEVATNLAGLSAAKRKTLAEKLQKSLRGADNLTSDQVTSFNNLAESLASKEVDASQLQGNLAVFGLPFLPPPLGVAIVIESHPPNLNDNPVLLPPRMADTWIEDNDINGIVSLYGSPGGPRLTPEQLTWISRALQQSAPSLAGHPLPALSLSGLDASLHVRNNLISRMTVSEATFAALRPPTLLTGNQRARALTNLYSRGFITDNVFRSGNNDFVMEHLALTSNSFVGPDAGVVFADAAIFVGNYAANSNIMLFNVARTSKEAANLTISIASPPPPPPLELEVAGYPHLARIDGKVSDSSGKLLPNVPVTLTGPDGITKTTQTDANGEFFFLNVRPGSLNVSPGITYTIVARSGTLSAQKQVTL